MRQELHPEKLLAAKPQAVFNSFLLISLVLQCLKVVNGYHSREQYPRGFNRCKIHKVIRNSETCEASITAHGK